MNSSEITLPKPKFKGGDRLFFVRASDDEIFKAYVCSWCIEIYSSGYSQVKYCIEFYDPEVSEYEDATEWDVSEERLFASELDAIRYKLKSLEKRYEATKSHMREMDSEMNEIRARINQLETGENT